MSELLLENLMKRNNTNFYKIFDYHQYFPLIDFSYNCYDYLDKILVTNNKFKKEVTEYHINLIKKSFLKDKKTPLWFMNNVVYENMYTTLSKEKLSLDAVDYFNKNGLSIYLSEPLNFYYNFYKNDLLMYLNIFAKNNKLKNLKVYTCEKNLKILNKKYKNIKLFCKNIFLTMVSLEINENCNLNIDFNKKNHFIKKKFWCGNSALYQHRHFIISFILSKLGNYSWEHRLDIRKNSKYVQAFQKNINSSRDFLKTIKNHNKKYYYRILINNQKILKGDQIKMDNGFSSKNPSIIQYYDECFCAVVTETYCNSIFADISEKTLYAIAYGKPFILVAPPGSLEYLRQLGFKTFEIIWDESYDQEKDTQKRIIKIFDLIENIDQLSIEELKVLYKKIQPVLEHNLTVLKKLQYNEIILK